MSLENPKPGDVFASHSFPAAGCFCVDVVLDVKDGMASWITYSIYEVRYGVCSTRAWISATNRGEPVWFEYSGELP